MNNLQNSLVSVLVFLALISNVSNLYAQVSPPPAGCGGVLGPQDVDDSSLGFQWVDNPDPNQPAYRAFINSGIGGSATITGNSINSDPHNWGIWTAPAGTNGSLEVSASIPLAFGLNLTSAATYTISHAGGDTDVTINQAANAGGVVSLGTYTFAGNGSVTLTDVVPEQGANFLSYIVFDAVSFGGALAGGFDLIPPIIEDVAVHTQGGEFIIQAVVADNCGLASVMMVLNGTSYAMTPDPSAPDLYSLKISVPLNETLAYQIIATDLAGNQGTWDPVRGYSNISSAYDRLGLNYAGYNGLPYGPQSEQIPCGSGCGQSTGDPINTVNGNLVDHTYLLEIPGRLPIKFHLTFNNQGGKESIFGLNMTHTYNYYVVEMDNQYFNGAFVHYPDGHVVVFENYQAEPGYYETFAKTGSGYELTYPNLHKVIFNEDGDIERYEDHNSSGLNFSYSDVSEYTLRSKLASILADGGREITFTYNGDDLVESIIDPDGKALQFGYKKSEQDQGELTPYLLTEFTDRNGGVTQFKYDETNNLLEKISPKGHPYFVNEFDEARRVTKQSVGTDFFYKFTYTEDPEDDSVVSHASATDANGHEIEYLYSGGLLVERIDQNGSTENYTYTANKNVESYIDKNGNTSLYEYDGFGNTVKITDPLSQVITQTYSPVFNKPTEIVNKQADHITQYGYDAVGNLISIYHALGDEQTFEYDALGQLTTRRDFNGNPTYFTYTTEGDVETITHADSGVEQFSYDSLGRILSYTDAEGVLYNYSHDGNDNLLSVQGPLGYAISNTYDANNHRDSHTDANGGTVYYEYDNKENKILERDQLGLERQYVFGAMNEMLAEVDEESVRTNYIYDPAYRLIDKVQAVNTSDEIHTLYVYDAHGNVISITDPEGRVTTQTFDALHRRTKIIGNTTSDPADHENNVSTEFTYSPTDEVLHVLDANGNPTEYEYDALDRLLLERDAENQVTTHSYDAQSNRVGMVNPRGFATTYGYDVMNRLTTVTDALGGEKHFSYDLNGNRVLDVDENTISTSHQFDTLNRRIATIRGFEGGGAPDSDTNVTTQYQYDLHGNLTKVINPRGFATTFEYDPTHRATQLTDAQGQITTITYDKVDNVLSQINRRGHAITYGYDDLYRTIEKTNEEGHVDSYTYDGVGNTLQHVNKRGIAHSYQYDPLNRLKTATNPYNHTKQYQYDAMGNILTITDENGHLDQYAYDKIYRKVSETDAEGFITQFAFDANSNLVQRVDAENNATTYSYDELDRLVTILNAENEEEQYAYDALRNVTIRTEADGTNHSFDYDNLYRLIQVVNNSKGGTQTRDTNVTTHYDYDPNGNLVNHADPNAHETTFAYDSLDRLVTEVNPIGSTWRYGYDPEGNVTARTDANSVVTNYAYFPDHKLQSVVYPDYLVQFSYNENNEPIQMLDQLGQTNWQYDLLDRIVSQTDPLSRSLAYAYDPVGNLTLLTYPDNRSISHEYLKNNWLSNSNTSDWDTISITRNKVGAPVHYQRSNSTTTDIVYDRVYRALNVKDQQLGGSLISQYGYTYNPVGHITEEVANYGWLQPSQVTTNYSYDGLHRLTQEENTDSLDNVFTYDPAGNRLELKEKIKQGYTTSSYAYDSANHMLGIDVVSSLNPENAVHTLKYDANGNRTDQLIQSNGVDRGVTYTYDTENRLTRHQNYLISGGSAGDDGTGEGPCNAGTGQGNGNGCNNNGNGQDNNNSNGNGKKNGQPNNGSGSGLGNSGGNATLNAALLKAHTDLAYDGIGRRLVSTYYPGASEGGKRTEFAFDRRDPIVEYTVWNQHTSNLYQDNKQNLLFKHALTAGDNVTSGNRFFYHGDGQSNISAVTKHQGQADKSYRYEAYGNILHPSSNAAVQRNGYSLSQKRFDADTELYYFGARHYDAFTGTWLTQDSYRGEINNPQSLHRAMYNYDSPVNYVDWYGHEPLICGPINRTYPCALHSVFGDMSEAINEFSSRVSEQVKTIVEYPSDAVGGTGDFAQAYWEMIDATYWTGGSHRGWSGQDAYFHCKANCEAAQRGEGGEDAAQCISNTREWFDQQVKGDPPAASVADQAANIYGRSKGSANPNGDCRKFCGQYRPGESFPF